MFDAGHDTGGEAELPTVMVEDEVLAEVGEAAPADELEEGPVEEEEDEEGLAAVQFGSR